jgi:hypothetical protein
MPLQSNTLHIQSAAGFVAFAGGAGASCEGVGGSENDVCVVVVEPSEDTDDDDDQTKGVNGMAFAPALVVVVVVVEGDDGGDDGGDADDDDEDEDEDDEAAGDDADTDVEKVGLKASKVDGVYLAAFCISIISLKKSATSRMNRLANANLIDAIRSPTVYSIER